MSDRPIASGLLTGEARDSCDILRNPIAISTPTNYNGKQSNGIVTIVFIMGIFLQILFRTIKCSKSRDNIVHNTRNVWEKEAPLDGIIENLKINLGVGIYKVLASEFSPLSRRPIGCRIMMTCRQGQRSEEIV